jgi:hypothetical protein
LGQVASSAKLNKIHLQLLNPHLHPSCSSYCQPSVRLSIAYRIPPWPTIKASTPTGYLRMQSLNRSVPNPWLQIKTLTSG